MEEKSNMDVILTVEWGDKSFCEVRYGKKSRRFSINDIPKAVAFAKEKTGI